MSEDACRADVWLWRARFFKTRSLAARFVDEGRVRLTRAGQEGRLDKCARPVKVGDNLVFALGGRLTAVRVEAMGDAAAAGRRTLYSPPQSPESGTLPFIWAGNIAT